MNLRDFRIGWRVLLQEPAYSAVVVGGLAVGFAACFLLLNYVRFSLSYNDTVPDAARVLLVKQRINVFPRPEYQTIAGLPLRDVALRSGLVQSAAVVKELDAPLGVAQRLQRATLLAVDPAFQDLFGIRAVDGDLAAALARPDGLALTLETATKLFGHTDVLGKTVLVNGLPLTVRALLPEPPANSTRRYDALTGIGGSAWPEAQRKAAFSDWGRGQIYVKLKPGGAGTSLAPVLQAALNQSPRDVTWRNGVIGKVLGGRNVSDVALTALPDVYFDPDLANGRDGANYGHKDSVFGLAAVALLILLLAATNYVNLATVRTLRRRRDTGMRKLLGASALQMARLFLAESVLVALLATVLGLTLAWLFLPLFADLVARQLTGFFTPLHCAVALLFGMLTGLLAGLYPAMVALRVRPGDALAGRGGAETAGGLWLRRVLTVLQFASAMALTGATVAIAWQTAYASHADPGFDPRGLLVIDLPEKAGDTAVDGFRDALARLPQVSGVATQSEAVGRDALRIVIGSKQANGDNLRIEVKYVSPGFFQLYGVQPVFGRLFDARVDQAKSYVAVINRAAALALGYARPELALGHTFTGNANGATIVGIAPDLRYRTLRETTEPMLYLLGRATVLSLRSSDSPAAAYDHILPLWRRYFPHDVLAVARADSFFALNYAEDRRLATMLAAASVVAIALAAFGIYVLAAYNVQRRRREIVLRKLHGAGHGAIARLLGREFAALLALGALAGLPLAALAIARYLASYVERAPLGVWPLLAAFGLALLVAALATLRHTLVAVRLAPALALRD